MGTRSDRDPDSRYLQGSLAGPWHSREADIRWKPLLQGWRWQWLRKWPPWRWGQVCLSRGLRPPLRTPGPCSVRRFRFFWSAPLASEVSGLADQSSIFRHVGTIQKQRNGALPFIL